MKRVKGFGLLEVIIIVIITMVLSSVATGVIMLNNNKANISNITSDKDLKQFIDVYNTLISKYYDKDIDKEGMLKSAEEAMPNYLNDKYTTYLDGEEYNSIINELSGSYNGIGVTIQDNVIIDVTKDGPAYKAGIQAGDIIIAVDKEDVTSKSSAEIGLLIRNGNNKEVSLAIKRNEENLTFTIIKENLIFPSIASEMIENTNIGYIYISNFSETLTKQVKKSLNELQEQGMTSLLIDVRDDAGGYLASAEELASIFLEEGKVIYSLETNKKATSYKDKTTEHTNFNIIVLVNENSASASEILAAALKDSYGATLVGKKTYGKGKVQQVMELSNGNSVKYTSAKWLTPTGICIDGKGIEPDYSIEYEKYEKYDSQINKAIEILNAKN